MKSFFSFLPVGLLVILLLALRLSVAAQAPAWQSARAVAVATATAGSNYSAVTATAVDAAGNVYLAGYFTNTVVLGSTTLTGLGGRDAFVAKFNPASNQFAWAQRAGGMYDDAATALAVSGTSVYAVGYFGNSMAGFGPTILTSAGGNEVFVAKFNDTGTFVWAQQAGGTGNDAATTVAVSGTSVYVAGYFGNSTASFGPVILNNVDNTGTSDVFVAKLIDAGSTSSFVWGQRAGGTNFDYAQALAVSGSSVYVAGYFGSATAGFGLTTLTNAGSSDVFVTKLTDAGSTGSFAWAQRAGGTRAEYAYALAVSGTSIYVAGSFSSATAGFGPVTLTSVTYSDMYVAKLTDVGSTGSFIWAQQAGGAISDEATALAVSGSSVYVAGDFGSLTASFGTTTLTNAGNFDVFVAKLTDAGSTGSFTWAQRGGGTGSDFAGPVAISGTSVYVAGHFAGPTTSFSLTTLSNPYPNNPYIGFLASLTDPILTATTTAHTLAPAQLFPNPAQRTATLRLPAGTVPAPLVLTDALGRAVRRYPAPASPEAVLDLVGLPAGLYLLRGAGPAQRLAVE